VSPGSPSGCRATDALQSLAQFPVVERARECAHLDASVSGASSGIRVDAFYQEGLHSPIRSGCPDIFASLSPDEQGLPVEQPRVADHLTHRDALAEWRVHRRCRPCWESAGSAFQGEWSETGPVSLMS